MMETKFTSIIDDVLKYFPPGGRFLLSYLSDLELNEWRSGCFVSFSLAGCLFISTVALAGGMCNVLLGFGVLGKVCIFALD